MISIINLEKAIKKKKVLSDITVNFEKGKIYGIFGKNGSGKTMLLRAIAGLIYPSKGEIKINDLVLHQDISFPKSMGILIENMELLPQYDAFDNLKILSRIQKKANDEEIDTSIKRVGLNDVRGLKIKKYSLGMKQRLNIAQAIFESPEIILLDEPTNAIDDEGIKLVQSLLVEEKNRGATIIIASHHHDEFLPICDKVMYMVDGKIRNEN
ncbi:ABC transporter ATP-binding protein [Sutcliffiella horikoshii]|uniref:ABC transporter ATP-binding protein n=1 Tax=Sutcliffiella horikoshii TaxID=79883 RepID=A0A5D4SWB7_9BACI|nr:ABC transporter ATP-binding protein [Sutcliffiella horikoshii]TYS67717.1 ABC transporter ATP-binding protein [Sutcliffiella horikoshii]